MSRSRQSRSSPNSTKALKRCVVRIQRLPHAIGLPLPRYQTVDAAGMDLVAAISGDAHVVMQPAARAIIPTGLVFELPSGTEAQVRPRSGLAIKSGVTVLNSPGTIDADYRGEVSVILINHGSEPFLIARGDRIAQLIVMPVAQAELVEAALLTETDRGSGGFGSTGTSTHNAPAKLSKRTPVARKPKNAKTATHKRPKAKRPSPAKR